MGVAPTAVSDSKTIPAKPGPMGVFEGCQITLELDSSVRFKQKLELKKKVTENGGIISFIVTKKVNLLLTS